MVADDLDPCTRSQVISNHGIGLGCQEYSIFKTRGINLTPNAFMLCYGFIFDKIFNICFHYITFLYIQMAGK